MFLGANMATKFEVGASVTWFWKEREIKGTVLQSSDEKMEKIIKRSRIIKHGTLDDPAYLVRSQKGNEALKLHSELKV